MRTALFFISSILLLCSCGKNGMDAGPANSSSNALSASGACANSIVLGNWRSTAGTGALIKFTGDCRYINEFCKSTGTYPANVMSAAGTVLITVDSKGSDAPSGCLPLGSYNCSYEIDKAVIPNRLGVVCAGVYGNYTKE